MKFMIRQLTLTPVSPVGSVGDKRLPPASIAPQEEGFLSLMYQILPHLF